ncbi:LysR family transcriptional regulator [Corallococcus sp. AB032C]|nr:LysR family transcriptional regulator [Corallococcus sp. AB032C]
MEILSAIGVFARVAETGSFASAARALGITPSAASKSVAHLEERLGTRLLQRTTRRTHLTEQGARLHERCVRALTELRDAESELAHAVRTPRVRVSVPEMLALRLIIPTSSASAASTRTWSCTWTSTTRWPTSSETGWTRRCAAASSPAHAPPTGPKHFILCASPAYLRRTARRARSMRARNTTASATASCPPAEWSPGPCANPRAPPRRASRRPSSSTPAMPSPTQPERASASPSSWS